jgi:hypothetical protein
MPACRNRMVDDGKAHDTKGVSWLLLDARSESCFVLILVAAISELDQEDNSCSQHTFL